MRALPTSLPKPPHSDRARVVGSRSMLHAEAQGSIISGRSAGEGVGNRAAADLPLAPNTVDNQDGQQQEGVRIGSPAQCSAQAMHALRACRGMGACDGKRMAGARAGAGQRQWPTGQSGLHLRGSDTGSAGFSCLGHQPFLQAPDLAYSPKIEIFHRGNRTALFVSSDATRCADHYGMLRYGRLQRVVSRLQVKV